MWIRTNKSATSKRRGLSILFSGLLLVGCANTPELSKPETKITQNVQSQEDLVFIDLEKFDRDLRQALDNKKQTISIKTHGNISVNSMPERLQDWLAYVDKFGHGIEVNGVDNKDDPYAKKSIQLALFLISKAIPYINNRRKKHLTENYKTLITLSPGSDRIETMQFVRLEQEAPEDDRIKVDGSLEKLFQ